MNWNSERLSPSLPYGGEENKFLPIPLAIVCLSAGSTEGLSGLEILEPLGAQRILESSERPVRERVSPLFQLRFNERRHFILRMEEWGE